MTEIIDKLKAQLKYARALRRIGPQKLRQLHDKRFHGTKWWVTIPHWMHRSVLEKRLFTYYCLRNYHLGKDTDAYRAYMKRARAVLSQEFVEANTTEDQATRELKEFERFTQRNIKTMPIGKVDRYLAGIGFTIDADETTRRRCLWEWFNKPVTQLPAHFNPRGRMRARRIKGEIKITPVLVDLILKFPTMNWPTFQAKYGTVLPTVTRNSFNVQRCLLRKKGHDIPVGKAGPAKVEL